MKRILFALALVLVLGPSRAEAVRYGSLRDVDAVSCSVTVNPAARALGVDPDAATSSVAHRLAAQGLVVDRRAPWRLVVLCEGVSLAPASSAGTFVDSHFVMVRMVLVRDRPAGTLVLWEDTAYGGWTGQGSAPALVAVEEWLDGMARDLALDYFRDAAEARPVPAPLTP
jgi:hypothetical protein